MADSPEVKALKSKLRKKVRERNIIREDLATLTKRDNDLNAEIKTLFQEALDLGLIERDKRVWAPSPKEGGYRLDLPEGVKYHEKVWRAHLEDVAPKVRKLVFKKTETFDRKALEKAIEAGDIPDVDELLENETFTEVKALPPRLTFVPPKDDSE